MYRILSFDYRCELRGVESITYTHPKEEEGGIFFGGVNVFGQNQRDVHSVFGVELNFCQIYKVLVCSTNKPKKLLRNFH